MKNRKRYLTIVIIPHHKGGQRSLHFSYDLLKRLVLVALAILLVLAALILSYGKILWRATQYEVMLNKQRQMEAEFAKLEEIKSQLAKMRLQEEKLRQMLGVPKQPDTLSTSQVSQIASPPQEILPGADSTLRIQDRFLPSLLPTRGWISAGFSPNHNGVDIAARQGQPIWSTADGLVVFAGWDTYFGNKIIIKHGERYVSIYGHCDKILVSPDQPVRRGQVIALVGSSGKSTGPHLHYELHFDGRIVDPANYWVNR